MKQLVDGVDLLDRNGLGVDLRRAGRGALGPRSGAAFLDDGRHDHALRDDRRGLGDFLDDGAGRNRANRHGAGRLAGRIGVGAGGPAQGNQAGDAKQ
jgi:hypothetical protein